MVKCGLHDKCKDCKKMVGRDPEAAGVAKLTGRGTLPARLSLSGIMQSMCMQSLWQA